MPEADASTSGTLREEAQGPEPLAPGTSVAASLLGDQLAPRKGRSSAGLSARGEGSLEPTPQTASFSPRSHSVTAALSQHRLVPGRGLLGSQSPGPLGHPPQRPFILFSSHAVIREARGGPVWPRMWIHLENSLVLQQRGPRLSEPTRRR